MWWLIGFLAGLLVVNVVAYLKYMSWRKKYWKGYRSLLKQKYYLVDQENERSIRHE